MPNCYMPISVSMSLSLSNDKRVLLGAREREREREQVELYILSVGLVAFRPQLQLARPEVALRDVSPLSFD